MVIELSYLIFFTKYKLSNERNDQIFLYVIFSDIPLPMVNVEFTIKCDVSSSKRILDYWTNNLPLVKSDFAQTCMFLNGHSIGNL